MTTTLVPVIIPRRSFLAALGLAAGTLALGLAPMEAAAVTSVAEKKWPSLPTGDGGFTPNVFVHVAPDGVVTIVSQRSEMGQGVRSSTPVVIADEMGADMAKVKIVQADGDAAYGDQNTDGSYSIRNGRFDDLRKVGAAARTMLIAAAAAKWHVPAAACEARDHAVFHAASKRSLGFGELAALAAKMPLPKPNDVTLRPVAELRHVGGPLPLLDAPDIVTGRAVYAADVRLPGMLTAMIARPPVVGGKVARFDDTRAKRIPGVRAVVAIPAPPIPVGMQPLGGIAVVADNTWSAMQGRAALDITWDHGPNASYDTARYNDELLASVRAPGKVVRTVGDVDGALAKAATKLEAEYHVPHLAHTAMEPLAAVARPTANGVEVWACSQDPQDARKEVAKTLKVNLSDVTIHVTFLGGGFGRKSKHDFIVEAALLAKQTGAPVRVQWTREDDVRHDYYHTTCTQRLAAGLDGQGKVIGWLHRTAFPSIRSTFEGPSVVYGREGELNQGVLDWPIAVPNLRAEVCEAKPHVRIGWLRSVNNINHAFAINSFIDEIAHARGRDPRENLLELIGRPDGSTGTLSLADHGVPKLPNYGASIAQHPVDPSRLRKVVERATELAQWGESRNRKSGLRALGVAAHRSFLTYVAVVAAVVPDGNGKIKVDEAWIVADPGSIVNAERVKSQFEGAVVFSMSHALHGAITMREGAVEQSNFRDYRLARITEVPRNIHVEIAPSGGPHGGVGEPGVPPVAPAIANAVFALTGKRVRELPLSRAGLIA